MKKIMKRLSIALMMLVFVMSLTACSSGEAEESVVDSTIVETLAASCESVMMTLPELTEEDIQAFLASGDAFTIAATNAWLDNREDLGPFVEMAGSTVEEDGDMYILTSHVVFSENNATVIMNFDSTGVPTYMSMEVNYSLGESMRQAGLNTLMGMGTVFAVLIFLVFIIGSLKYVGIALEGGNKKETGHAPAQKPVNDEEVLAVIAAAVAAQELVDDKELAAVVAAAIAAYENTSTDSFVVRSIRRKSSNKWSRA